MTERPERPPIDGDYRNRTEYDTSNRDEMMRLKLGAFTAIHTFLDSYQSTPNSRLELFYKNHTTAMVFEDQYEEAPEPEAYLFTDGYTVRRYSHTPQSFRREVAIETRSNRWGVVPDTADVTIHDFHGSRAPLECYYSLEAYNGGVVHAVVGHTMPRRMSRDDNLQWYRTQERNMMPYDFQQLHRTLAEIGLARARIIANTERTGAV